MVIRHVLEALPITTKARRLQALWPLIEQKLLAGTSHADILRALNDGGFDLSQRTYKTYVYRFRKRHPQAQYPAPYDCAGSGLERLLPDGKAAHQNVQPGSLRAAQGD